MTTCTSVRASAVALLGLLAISGCAGRGRASSTPGMGLRELEGGVELAIKRGSGWTTLTVKPPYIVGPRTNLELKNGVFTGSIDGRAVRVAVDGASASGFGPHGPIQIEVADGPDELIVDGTWSGSRVALKVTQDAFRGTLPIFTGSDLTSTLWCQYVLDTVEDDGSWSGVSTCTGMPENTRLEVPESVQRWLTRPELVVVVLTLLSSPPITGMERRFP